MLLCVMLIKLLEIAGEIFCIVVNPLLLRVLDIHCSGLQVDFSDGRILEVILQRSQRNSVVRHQKTLHREKTHLPGLLNMSRNGLLIRYTETGESSWLDFSAGIQKLA